MITLQTLPPEQVEDLHQVLTGYVSPWRYKVEISESDAETTFALRLETLPEPYVKSFINELTADDLQMYRQYAEQGLSLAAYARDRLVGMAIAAAEYWNRTLWIWEFHVLPSVQKLGVGRLMMGELANRGQKAGLRTLRVETQNTNVPAIRFYRRVGFHLEALDTSFYSNHDLESGEVALFMKRRLE